MADKKEITKKPTAKVQDFTISRTKKSHEITAKWKVPSGASDDSDHRATVIIITWSVLVSEKDGYTADKNESKLKKIVVRNEHGISKTDDHINLSNFKANGGDFKGKSFTRRSFQPVGKWYLVGVKCTARFHNKKGDGPVVRRTYSFKDPDAPKVANITHDHDTGRLTCKITAYNWSGKTGEVYDTRFQVKAYDSRTKKYPRDVDDTFMADTKSYSFDVQDRMQLMYTEYVMMKCRARCRGYTGGSKWTDWVTRYVSYPTVVTITDVNLNNTSNLGKTTVLIETGKDTGKKDKTGKVIYKEDKTHPVTGVRLQRLRSVDAKTADQATAMSDEWEDLDIVDNGYCTALAVSNADVRPTVDKTTWLRVKSWNTHEDLFYRYSTPWRIKKLESKSETAKDDKIQIIYKNVDYQDAEALVVFGFNEDYSNTGIELSWSTSSSAWNSTEQPTVATLVFGTDITRHSYATIKGWSTIDGDKAARNTFVDKKYGYGAYRYISNLEPGETYYVRVRLYLEGETTTYSAYSNTLSFSVPETITGTKCAITGTSTRSGGTSAKVVVGYKAADDPDGFELSWSLDSNAWKSSVEPDRFEFNWKDSGTISHKDGWNRSSTAYLSGLTQNSSYTVKARLYYENGSTKTYTSYSPAQTLVTNVSSSDTNSIGIVSATPQADGKSVAIIVGWTESRNNNGTEISWSESPDAWSSTEQPSTFQFDWFDQPARNQTGWSKTWNKTAEVIVSGLDEGTPYYFRARRYLTANTITYTNYCAMVSAIPSSAPEKVVLSAPEFVTRGSGFEVSWTFDSDAQQKGWQLITGDVVTKTETVKEVVDGQTVTSTRKYLAISDSKRKIISRGTDSLGSCAVSAARMNQLTEGGDSIHIAVRVSTGGAYVESEAQTVTLADIPALSLIVEETLTEQPFSFKAISTDASELSAVILSEGSSGAWPDGDREQASGDVVWSNVVSPVWAESVTIDRTNLISNLPRSWSVSSNLVSLRRDAEIPVTAGTTYSVSLSDYEGAWDGVYRYDWRIAAIVGYNASGTAVDSATYYTTSGSSFVDNTTSTTWTPSTAVTAIVRLVRVRSTRDDEETETVTSTAKASALVTMISDPVHVKFEEGSTATEWTPSVIDTGSLEATVQVPGGLDFWDRGRYTLRVTAKSAETGLTSEVSEAAFDVLWRHQAPRPSAAITIVPSDTTDDNGVRTIQSVIKLAPPSYNYVLFGTVPFSDVYNASTNPDGYWRTTPSDWFTQLEDGWIHVYKDNSEGSSQTTTSTIRPSASDLIVAGTEYTVLIEIRNNNSTGTETTDMYVQQIDNNQFWGSDGASVNLLTCGEEYESRESKVADVDHHEQGVDATEAMRWNFRCGAGSVVDYDFRVSVYEADYDGDYDTPVIPADIEGDLYDVYRVTPDGPYLIASGCALDDEVTDPYSPFGGSEKGYRVASRTVDGDVDWSDYEYDLPGRGMRIDFGDDYVELPYNVAWSDSYSKDFEARSHIGESRAQGYWNDSITRRASMSTDLIKIAEQEKAAKLRKLAQYPHPCFVRMSDGCAYEANVDVGISPRYRSLAIGVSLDVTEIGLTDEFRGTVPVTNEGNG